MDLRAGGCSQAGGAPCAWPTALVGVTDVLERVRATGLLSDGSPVVVLLSGGRDSVCLLDCAVELGSQVTALHVNYGLRESADADERHCEELCDRLAVPLEV